MRKTSRAYPATCCDVGCCLSIVPFWRIIMQMITPNYPTTATDVNTESFMIHLETTPITDLSDIGDLQHWWDVFASWASLNVPLCWSRLSISYRISWPAAISRISKTLFHISLVRTHFRYALPAFWSRLYAHRNMCVEVAQRLNSAFHFQHSSTTCSTAQWYAYDDLFAQILRYFLTYWKTNKRCT